MLVPEPLEQRPRCVDVRDLAAWLLACARTGTTGTFDAVGPVAAAAASGSRTPARWAGTPVRSWPCPRAGCASRGSTEWAGPESLPMWIADPTGRASAPAQARQPRRQGCGTARGVTCSWTPCAGNGWRASTGSVVPACPPGARPSWSSRGAPASRHRRTDRPTRGTHAERRPAAAHEGRGPAQTHPPARRRRRGTGPAGRRRHARGVRRPRHQAHGRGRAGPRGRRTAGGGVRGRVQRLGLVPGLSTRARDGRLPGGAVAYDGRRRDVGFRRPARRCAQLGLPLGQLQVRGEQLVLPWQDGVDVSVDAGAGWTSLTLHGGTANLPRASFVVREGDQEVLASPVADTAEALSRTIPVTTPWQLAVLDPDHAWILDANTVAVSANAGKSWHDATVSGNDLELVVATPKGDRLARLQVAVGSVTLGVAGDGGELPRQGRRRLLERGCDVEGPGHRRSAGQRAVHRDAQGRQPARGVGRRPALLRLPRGATAFVPVAVSRRPSCRVPLGRRRPGVGPTFDGQLRRATPGAPTGRSALPGHSQCCVPGPMAPRQRLRRRGEQLVEDLALAVVRGEVAAVGPDVERGVGQPARPVALPRLKGALRSLCGVPPGDARGDRGQVDVGPVPGRARGSRRPSRRRPTRERLR